MFKRFIYILAAASFIFGGVTARAQDAGALLDLLVRKKIITDQEAEEVRAELTKETATTSAGKLKLSAPITELELYGDIRLRYEYRGGRTAGNTPVGEPGAGVAGVNDWQERERERYRLRIGLRGTLADDWFFGIRLETSNKRNSTNVTFGNDGTSGTPAVPNGPFAKDDDGLFIGQAYLGYKGFRDVTLTGGRMPNPIVTTLMVWDADINPEGAAEQWKHSFTFSFGESGVAQAEQSYSKDNKALAIAKPAAEPWKLKIDVFANFAQFVYDDSNPENPLGGRGSTGGRLNPNTDAWLMGLDTSYAAFHETLLKMLQDSSTIVRGNAALSLVRFGDASGRAQIVALLQPARIVAPSAGLVVDVDHLETSIHQGGLIAKLRDGQTTTDVRSPISGRIRTLSITKGTSVAAGTELASLDPGVEQIWEALRALYLVGQAADLPLIRIYQRDSPEIPDRIRQQAQLTEKAIHQRAAKQP